MSDSRLRSVLTAAEISEEDQHKVLAKMREATTEPTVGTVIRNPATGDVAVFVRQYDQSYWRVVSSEDRTWSEFESLFTWDVLHQPE